MNDGYDGYALIIRKSALVSEFNSFDRRKFDVFSKGDQFNTFKTNPPLTLPSGGGSSFEICNDLFQIEFL